MLIAPPSADLLIPRQITQLLRHLLIVDGQLTFCDLPWNYRMRNPRTGELMKPGLPVKGAHMDMVRLGAFIRVVKRFLSSIAATLDSHHRVSVEITTFWKQGNGLPVDPYTEVLARDVRAGRYLPRDPSLLARVLQFLDATEARGRTLRVWPPHSGLGTWEHALHFDVQQAVDEWAEERQTQAQLLLKGLSPWVDQFSAVRALVPDPEDPSTYDNLALLEPVVKADQVFIGGIAGSHCVKDTVLDIVAYFEANGFNLSKIVLLTDAMSPVETFEADFQAFLAAMKAKGLRLATTVEVTAELLATTVDVAADILARAAANDPQVKAAA